MANEFKVKNGLIVIGDLTTSGTITINGALAATQSWVTSQAYLTSASLSGYATQSYVTSALAALVDAAPAALDTLNELAAALGDDASFSTTITNSIAGKVAKSGDTMTGDLTLNYGYPRINFYDSGNNPDYSLINNDGDFSLYDITNNVHRLWVSAVGNVGIGTTSPTQKLDVAGNISLDEYLYHRDSAAQYLRFIDTSTIQLQSAQINFSLGSTSAPQGGDFQFASPNGSDFTVSYTRTGQAVWKQKFVNQTMYWENNVGNVVYFANNAGNVGIGTTSPNEKLDVRGNIYIPQNNYIYFDNSGHYIRRGASDVEIQGYNGIQLRTNSTTRVYIDQTGNVGIGTTSPSAKFEIGAVGTDAVAAKLTQGFERVRFNTFDLLGYNDGHLWMIGNNAPSIVLGASWDWDQQVEFAYTPGTIGAASGLLDIGQTSKNSATYTHGVTRFFTNGSEAMRINSTGNIGIGTTSPGAKLHVDSSVQQFRISGNTNHLNMYSWASGVNVWSSENLYFGRDAATANKIFFQNGSASTTTMYVNTATEVVVVGTNTAFTTGGTAKLSILGSSVMLTMGASASNLMYFRQAGAGEYQIQTNNGGNDGNIQLQPYGGNVGIGTTAPSYKLEVNGNSYVSGQSFLRSHFSSYTTDGLFNANALWSGVLTPSGVYRVRFGYLDQGGGQYWGRVGFVGNTNWSLGTAQGGHSFSIGTGNGNAEFLINNAGKVSIGTSDTNSDKSDFTVYTGSGASLALVDDQVRMGSTDVNWGVALRSTGYLETYGQALYLQSVAGNHPVVVRPNNTSSVEFYQDYTLFNGLNLSISRINSVHAANYFRGDSSHLVIGTGGTLYLNYGGNTTNITGNTTVSGLLGVTGIVSAGARKLSMGILALNTEGTPAQYKIKTNIPWNYGGSDFTVNIKGFRYGTSQMVSLSIGWHYYNNEFYNRNAISNGAWAPTISLAKSPDGYVIIHIPGPNYWAKLYVESVYSANSADSYTSGWSWTDADLSDCTLIQTVPYKDLATNISGNAATATYATTAGALSSMNISQFTNNSGYITGYSETDTLNSVTSRGNSTYDRINVRGAGNQGGGNIMMGNIGEGTNKWSYLTSTHYNASSQPQGFALIGGLATSGGNAVVIGGNIYESNPATEIQFWTHSSNTHNLGGTQRGVINSAGNWGIGTTTPGDYRLYVNGGQWGTLLRGGDLGTGSDVVRMIKSDNSVAMIVRGDGNVGIGTASPGAKLHVVGNTYIQSGVLFVDTIAGYATNLISLAASTNVLVPSGDITIGSGASISSTQPFGDFSQLKFDNLHSDTNRGPNKIVMHDNGGSWIGGFGIHSDTVSYYTGGHHRWYKTDSQTSSSQVMQLDPSGNLSVTGTFSASGYNKSNWDTAYSWGNHASYSYATTSYVTTQINNLINGAPGVLDTLDELAAALGDDANFATTVTNSIAGKVSKAGDTITTSNNYGLVIDHTPVLGDFVDALLLRSTTSAQRAQLGFATVDSDGNHHRASIRAYKGAQALEGVFGVALRQPNATHIQRLTLDYLGNLTIGGFLTESSSLKLKENIETSEGNLEKVVNLRPVTYNKIGSQTTELGLIAEEVAEVYPEFVQYDENGEPIGVNYSRLTAALIGAVKELTNQVQELNKKING